jgi:hypothetical protein
MGKSFENIAGIRLFFKKKAPFLKRVLSQEFRIIYYFEKIH